MTALITIAAFIIAGMGWAIVVLWKQRIAARDEAADERANAAWWRALAEQPRNDTLFLKTCELLYDRTGAIMAIERATRDGKSGTAKMVHRMAKNVLDV